MKNNKGSEAVIRYNLEIEKNASSFVIQLNK